LEVFTLLIIDLNLIAFKQQRMSKRIFTDFLLLLVFRFLGCGNTLYHVQRSISRYIGIYVDIVLNNHSKIHQKQKNELGRTRNANGRMENTQKNIRMEASRWENQRKTQEKMDLRR
jgi:hypothetical protein